MKPVFSERSVEGVGDGRNEPSASSAAFGPVVLFILATLVIRVLYLAFVSQWELVADEAHYWEWSRRLALSYYTKGPGIAWVIRLSTSLFGDTEAAIRFPSAVASGLMTLAGARLAYEMTARSGRAAWSATLALTLAPAYFATAQLATTDVFYASAWLITAWFIWQAFRPDATTGRQIAGLAGAGCVVGIGCLFKYTMLFELAGLTAFLCVQRRQIVWSRALAIGGVLGAIGMIAFSSPILIWNAQHGWPTIAHQIGRLRLPGGDESVEWKWSPGWLPEYFGAQLGLLGGVGAVLVVMSVRRARDSAARSLLVWLAVPIVVFYIALSAVRHAQGNWAIAGYTTLLVLVGIDVAAIDALLQPRYRALWVWNLCIGVVVGAVLLFGPLVTQIPWLGNLHALQRAHARLSGASSRAGEVQTILDNAASPSGVRPFVLTKSYQEASLLAFYLPGHPAVLCAASHLGSRPNSYDFFADTNLDDSSRFGRDVVVVGDSAERWRHAFYFNSVEPIGSRPGLFFGKCFGGSRNTGAARPAATDSR